MNNAVIFKNARMVLRNEVVDGSLNVENASINFFELPQAGVCELAMLGCCDGEESTLIVKLIDANIFWIAIAVHRFNIQSKLRIFLLLPQPSACLTHCNLTLVVSFEKLRLPV